MLGGPLTVTDANLVLGRLLPDYFPKIFGKNEDQPLDFEASFNAFKELTKQVSKVHQIVHKGIDHTSLWAFMQYEGKVVVCSTFDDFVIKMERVEWCVLYLLEDIPQNNRFSIKIVKSSKTYIQWCSQELAHPED